MNREKINNVNVQKLLEKMTLRLGYKNIFKIYMYIYLYMYICMYMYFFYLNEGKRRKRNFWRKTAFNVLKYVYVRKIIRNSSVSITAF